MYSLAPTNYLEVNDRIQVIDGLLRSLELEKARARCEALIQDAQAADPVVRDGIVAQASYWAARCARRQDRPDDALQFLYAGIGASRRANQGRAECLLRAELAHVLSALSQNSDALEQADAALQRATLLGDQLGIAAARESIAVVYWRTGDWEFCLGAYQTALELASACGSLELRVLCTLGLAASELGIANEARDAGRTAEAVAPALRSVQLQRDSGVLAAALGDDYLLMYSELNLGLSLCSTGAREEAKKVLEICLDNPRHEAVHGSALNGLGEIALEEGQPELALLLLLRALQLCEAKDKPSCVQMVLESLVRTYEALAHPAKALLCMRRFHELYVKNASERSRLMARAMSIKHETEQAIAFALAQRQRAELLENNNANLARESAEHARKAMEDALTGVANRRRFDQALQAQLTSAGQLAPCSIALLDVDHFKLVNDRFSHLVGDEVLRRIGALLAANCRRNDLAARYGGEEFVLLSTDVPRTEMQHTCERIRDIIAREDWSALRLGLRVTVSIGVAHHDEIVGSVAVTPTNVLERLVALADERLYAAKSAGRNQVCDGTSQGADGELAGLGSTLPTA